MRPLFRAANGRHGIEAAIAPGVAAADASDAQPRAPEEAMTFHGLHKIFRATRLETASGARARQPVKEGRNRELINLLKESCEKFHGTNRAGWNRAAQAAPTLPREPGIVPWQMAPSQPPPARAPESTAAWPPG